jgi:hypothetical protein
VSLAVACGSSELDELSERWRSPDSTSPTDGRTERERVFDTMFDKRLLIGERAATIREQLGRPAEVRRLGATESWVYPVRSRADGRCVAAVLVNIEREVVSGVVTGEPCA